MQIFTYKGIEYEIDDVEIDGDNVVLLYGSFHKIIPLADYQALVEEYGK